MPPKRSTSAAADETIRRARGGAASQRGRNRSDAAFPPGNSGGHGASASTSERNVDWDAIFRTIDGQAHGQGGQAGPSHRPYLPPVHSGYDYEPVMTQGMGSTSMSAGPSSAPSHHPPPPPWTSDSFHFGLDGLAGHPSPDSLHSRAPSPHRPGHPSRSQSFPFYHESYRQSLPHEYLDNSQVLDSQSQPHPLDDIMPPPSGIAPFGMGSMSSEPNSFGTGSGSSVASLLEHSSSAYNHLPANFPRIAAPTCPADQLGHSSSSMNPPPPVINRRQQSISHHPFDFSGQSSVNPSPAPTPLSNPTSGEDTEDKRVRNTVASAKFRAKKKEQIANVQRQISDLEVQQAGLEADVASLRNENGLLREMVQIKYGTKIPEN